MFGFNMFPHEGGMPRTFTATYRCFSVSMLPGQERQDVDKGGKIIMPPSALDQLTRLNIQYPMLFKLANKRTDRETHCGVLEFVADEGRIYIPYWMMTNLLLEEGGLVHLENVSLPVATFAKFEPQCVDFLDISNPKAVLENNLRNFACLTSGDMLAIKYNEKVYELRVLETKPGRAVSIIECDMNVEFAPPVGYQEPEIPAASAAHHEEEEMPVDAIDYIDTSKFRAFSGEGNRLDGKKRGQEMDAPTLEPCEIKRGIPNYDFKKGKITFIRVSRNANGNGKDKDKDQDSPDFAAFSGEGRTLKTKNTRKV